MTTTQQNGMTVIPPKGGLVRQEFGATQLEHKAETAGTAVAAREQAAVQARSIVAMQRPRDVMIYRDRLLKECERPGFARVAKYAKPVGGQRIVGPSVRFAEACFRLFGNLDLRAPVVFDDAEKRIIQVQVVDLEGNVGACRDITILKTIERKKPEGYEVLGKRTNTYGDTVYIVKATDDDLLNKQEALVSKMRRNLILQMLPGDITAEAMEIVEATIRKGEAAEDPDARVKSASDAFGKLGISTAMLTDYLGHPLAELTPDEAADLRIVWTTLSDGEAKWSDVMEQRRGEAIRTPGAAPSSAREKVAAKAAKARQAMKPVTEEDQAEAALREPGSDDA